MDAVDAGAASVAAKEKTDGAGEKADTRAGEDEFDRAIADAGSTDGGAGADRTSDQEKVKRDDDDRDGDDDDGGGDAGEDVDMVAVEAIEVADIDGSDREEPTGRPLHDDAPSTGEARAVETLGSLSGTGATAELSVDAADPAEIAPARVAEAPVEGAAAPADVPAAQPVDPADGLTPAEADAVAAANAMRAGLTPAEAGLPPELFPPEYVARADRVEAAQEGVAEAQAAYDEAWRDAPPINVFPSPEQAETRDALAAARAELAAAREALPASITETVTHLDGSQLLAPTGSDRAVARFLADEYQRTMDLPPDGGTETVGGIPGAPRNDYSEAFGNLAEIGRILEGGVLADGGTLSGDVAAMFFNNLGVDGTAQIPHDVVWRSQLLNPAIPSYGAEMPYGSNPDAAAVVESFSSALARATLSGTDLTFSGADLVGRPQASAAEVSSVWLFRSDGPFEETFLEDATVRVLETTDDSAILRGIGAEPGANGKYLPIGSDEEGQAWTQDPRILMLRHYENDDARSLSLVGRLAEEDKVGLLLGRDTMGYLADGGAAAGRVLANLAVPSGPDERDQSGSYGTAVDVSAAVVAEIAEMRTSGEGPLETGLADGAAIMVRYQMGSFVPEPGRFHHLVAPYDTAASWPDGDLELALREQGLDALSVLEDFQHVILRDDAAGAKFLYCMESFVTEQIIAHTDPTNPGALEDVLDDLAAARGLTFAIWHEEQLRDANFWDDTNSILGTAAEIAIGVSLGRIFQGAGLAADIALDVGIDIGVGNLLPQEYAESQYQEVLTALLSRTDELTIMYALAEQGALRRDGEIVTLEELEAGLTEALVDLEPMERIDFENRLFTALDGVVVVDPATGQPIAGEYQNLTEWADFGLRSESITNSLLAPDGVIDPPTPTPGN